MRFILSADWHLREDKPRCRKDDNFYLTQKNAVEQVVKLANDKDCDLFVVGDIFHRYSEFKLVKLVQEVAVDLNHKFYYLAGNHDMQYHNISNISAISLLEHSFNCYKINTIKGVASNDFGMEIDKNAEYVFVHQLCFPNRNDIPPNVEALCADDLLDTYQNAKYIFTGDYHCHFHIQRGNRHVVNSGCLLRQTSDMKDYKCAVYYIDTDKDTVEIHYLEDDSELVDDSYIIKQKEEDERINSFVDKLKNTRHITLDFIDNVERALLSNDLSEDVIIEIKRLIQDV